MFVPVIGIHGLQCVMAAAQRGSEGHHLSGPGVWVSGWHHLLPASWRLLGLLSISQGDSHELNAHIPKHCHLKPQTQYKPQALHTKKHISWSAGQLLGLPVCLLVFWLGFIFRAVCVNYDCSSANQIRRVLWVSGVCFKSEDRCCFTTQPHDHKFVRW